jgi:uncharacterized membrane protein YhiD involved in acid resistance
MPAPKPQETTASHSNPRTTNICLACFGLAVGAGGVFSWFPESYLGKVGLWTGAMIALGSAFVLHLLLTEPEALD